MPAQLVVNECAPEVFEEVLDEALELGGWIQLSCPSTNQLTTTKRISVNTILENTAATGWLVMGSSNRFFEIDPGVRLTLINVRLSSGQAVGAAGAAGSSTADGAPGGGGFGGAVLNNGGFLVGSNVTFFNCKAQGGKGGKGADGVVFGGPPTSGGPGGSGWGGAVYNAGGEVWLTNSTFQSCLARGGEGGGGGSSTEAARDGGDGGPGGEAVGGAVFTTQGGAVWLYGCKLDRNTAEGAKGGAGGLGAGAVYFDGSNGSSGAARGGGMAQDSGRSHVEGGEITWNLAAGANGLAGTAHSGTDADAAGEAGEPGWGGGLAVTGGSLLLLATELSHNSAIGGNGGDGGRTGGSGNGGDGGAGGSGQGGGLYVSGETVVDCVDSSFARNEVFGGYGGLGEIGEIGLADSGRDGAAAAGEGGGAYLAGATANVLRCTVERNETNGGEGREGAPGNAYTPGSPGNPGGAAQGGGLFAWNTQLAVTNSTFYANKCLGGLGGLGGQGGSGLLFATDGGDGGNGGPALGGGAWCDSAQLTAFISCTFSTNVVTGGTNGLGGAAGDTALADPGNPGSQGTAAGASIASGGAEILIRNTLLAYPGGGENATGSITNGGYNFSSTDSPPFGNTNLSTNNVDPRLRPLADNGGPTFTCALSTNSPALDTANPQQSPPTDQRGVARGNQPDRGAYEAGDDVPIPALAIHGQDPILVAWPDWAITYRLESTPKLPATGWSAAGPAQILAGQWTVRIDPTNAPRYYRLRQ